MVLITQLMEGLWQRRHGFPTIKFHPASFMTWKMSSSMCWSMASFKLYVCVICPTMERAPLARTKSSGFPLGTKGKFMFMAKSRSINWELAPRSIMHVAGMSSLTKHGNVRGFSDPKSPDTDTDSDTDTHSDTVEILKARDKPKCRRALLWDFREILTTLFPVPSNITSSNTEKREGTKSETGTEEA